MSVPCLSLLHVKLAAFGPGAVGVSWSMGEAEYKTIVVADDAARQEWAGICSGTVSPADGEVCLMGRPLQGGNEKKARARGIESTLWRQPWHWRFLDWFRPPSFEEYVARAAKRAGPDGMASALERFEILGLRKIRFGQHPANTAQRCVFAAMWARRPRMMVLADPFRAWDANQIRQGCSMLARVRREDRISILVVVPEATLEAFHSGEVLRLDPNGLKVVDPPL